MSHNRSVAVTRRRFVQHTGLMAGGALLAGVGHGHAAEPAADLPHRTLGRTGVEVSTLTLGTAPCGHSTDYSPDDVAKVVNTALDLGVTSIDTAPLYGNAEEGVGRALGPRRQDVFLAV